MVHSLGLWIRYIVPRQLVREKERQMNMHLKSTNQIKEVPLAHMTSFFNYTVSSISRYIAGMQQISVISMYWSENYIFTVVGWVSQINQQIYEQLSKICKNKKVAIYSTTFGTIKPPAENAEGCTTAWLAEAKPSTQYNTASLNTGEQ